MKRYLAFILACGMVQLLCAQGQELIDTVEVSSSQIPQRMHETGRHITVLLPKTIEQLPAVSVDEILQMVPGVEVQSRSGFGVQADIVMRGSTFSQVLILVDGMRLNDPLTGHFNGYIPVVKSDIARIEVLRGPAAAMYGPDAVGGLINIITKTFEGSLPEGISGNVNVGLGSYANYMGEAAVLHGSEKFSWSLTGMINRADGQPFRERAVNDSLQLDAYSNYFDLRTVGGALSIKLRPGLRLKLRTAFDYRDFSARYFYTASPLDLATERVNQSFSVLQLEQVKAKRVSDIQLAYKYNTDVFAFNPNFPSTNEHATQFGNFISNHLFDLSPKLMLKGGVQVDYRSIESNDRGNHSDWHAGIYTMAMYQPTDRLNLTGSLRADYDENYDLEVLPQLNASFVLEHLVLRAAVGRSIRAADYTERYVSNNLPMLTPGRNLGNPDVMAEASWSQELGADAQLAPGLLVKATGFMRQSSRLIDYVPTSAAEIGDVGDLQPEASYFFARNISDVSTAGVEFEALYQVDFSKQYALQVSAGYTFVNTSNAEDIVSVYIANHARQLVTGSALMRFGKTKLGVSGLYKQRNELFAAGINSRLEPEYMLWNLRSAYQVTEMFSVSLLIQNVFDTDYQNVLGAPMPGRWMIGSFSVKF
jgi:iron complex outermembrane receptor protein